MVPPYYRNQTLPDKPTVIDAAMDHGEHIPPTDSIHLKLQHNSNKAGIIKNFSHTDSHANKKSLQADTCKLFNLLVRPARFELAAYGFVVLNRKYRNFQYF